MEKVVFDGFGSGLFTGMYLSVKDVGNDTVFRFPLGNGIVDNASTSRHIDHYLEEAAEMSWEVSWEKQS